MTAVDNVNFSVRHIFAIAFRLARVERELILAPYHQQARLLLAHPRLPFRVGVHVGSVVVEQIALNLSLAGLVEKIEFVSPQIWVIAFDIGVVSDMARARRSQGEKIR